MNNEEFFLRNQICFTVYNIYRLFNKFYQKALEKYNLTYTQYIVLMALWEKDHQTLKELSQILDLQSNTLTPLLKRMEASGWIIREQPKNDKRKLIIHLTSEAVKQQEDILNAVIPKIEKRKIPKEAALEFLLKFESDLKEIVENVSNEQENEKK